MFVVTSTRSGLISAQLQRAAKSVRGLEGSGSRA